MATQILVLVSTVVQVVLALTLGSNPTRFANAAGIYGIGTIAAVAVFLLWFRRCRRNAEVLAPGGHRYPVGRAVWSWFTPLVMWWAPRRITLDIWRAGGSVGGAWVIEAWWVAWLANSAGVVAYSFISHGKGDSPYVAVVHLVGAVLAVLMVRQVTAAQDVMVGAAAATPA
ncbi:DUF4328 domain-containing protein [Kitasatospora nipponensis]|uniref:DUF4328 domain-containing protein n=1 Tax=Kitasatospora nipponensis TaxID=258049 RepID=UPI0031DAD127